ncbi:MAG: histidine kinase N-terminal 7TM domain-containing protein [Thermodesulfobacteriota bacterium]
MNFQYSNIAAFSFLTCALSAFMGAVIWRHRKIPGGTSAVLMMVAISEWTLCRGLEAASILVSTKIIWAKFEYFGITVVPAIWLVFVHQYSNAKGLITRRTIPFLFILPFFTMVMVFTNEFHGMIWSEIRPVPGRETEMLQYAHGLWFWIHAVYNYALMAWGTLCLAASSVSNFRIYKLQSLSILLAALIPWIGNAFYLAGYTPVESLDLTPFALTLTGLIIGWSIYRHRLFQIVPVARDRLIENLSDGVIVLDSGNRIIDVNPAAKRLIRNHYSLEIGNMIDESLISAAHPNLSLYDTTEINKEIRITDDLGPRCLSITITLLHDTKAEVAGKVILLRDVTKSRSAEDALRESEERFRKLSDAAEEGIAIHNNGIIIDVNNAFSRMFGYEPSELIGKYGETLVTSETWQQILDRLAVGYSRPYQGVGVRKDGRQFICQMSGKPFSYMGKQVRIATFRDITDIITAEEALKKSEKQYRELFDNITDFIYTHDLEGKILSANRSVSQILGYPHRDLIGYPIYELMPAEFRTAFEQDYFPTIKSKGQASGVSIFLGKDGKKYYIEYHNKLVTGEDGSQYISGSGRDITDRVLANKKVKELQGQILQSKKMEAIGTLAGGVAHDFNNLLMGIYGRVSLMMLGIDASHSHYEHLRGIEDYVKSASNLTKQLLGFARGGKYETKSTNINELLIKSSEMFGRTRKEISIHRSLQDSAWPVEVDRGQIEQVLINLYLNAWQAMPKGGELFIQSKNLTVYEPGGEYYSLTPGRYVKISIKDTGCGMDKATQERIFDPFFTTKEMGRGTGLGLASAYGIIKNHSGLIQVISQPGEGSTFNIYLPVSNKKIESEQEIENVILKGEETILLVDDEEMILEVGEQILDKIGYRVLKANSGLAAVSIYESHRADISLVILDLIMPEIGGGETFDRLIKINPEVKVLLSSGYSIEGQAQSILDRGCSGFIQKPFGISDLSKKIREILDSPPNH